MRDQVVVITGAIHVTTVSPGVVATEFGVKALGGGVDSRRLPNAQPAEEVIAEVIEQPRADVYSRPIYAQLSARYYSGEDLGVVETQPPYSNVLR